MRKPINNRKLEKRNSNKKLRKPDVKQNNQPRELKIKKAFPLTPPKQNISRTQQETPRLLRLRNSLIPALQLRNGNHLSQLRREKTAEGAMLTGADPPRQHRAIGYF
jgi:hypothetical protein